VPPDPTRRRPAIVVRALIFAGFVALGAWHVARLQSPRPDLGEIVVPLVLALAVALAATRGLRPLLGALIAWVLAVGWWVGGAGPSATHPLAIVVDAFDRVQEGVSRFAVVVLPFDPIAEPGLHAVLLSGIALWLLALTLIWLVAARPLPAIVLGALPVALTSSEFPVSRPGLRVALLVALVVCTLGAGRRNGARPLAAVAVPLALIALLGAGLPGLARASFLDWHAWGRGGGDAGSAAADVQYAWDQTYEGLRYTGEPVVVLRVRSPRPAYWRVTVLDSFDGLRFEERSPGATVARPGTQALVEPRPAGRATTLHVETEALDEPYLVAAGNPVSFQVPDSTGGGTIDRNGVLRVLRPPSHGTTYAVSAVIADPSRAQLRHRAAAAVGNPDALDGTPFADAPALPAFGDPQHDGAVRAALARSPAWRSAYAWAVHATAGATTPFDVALKLEETLRSSHPYNGTSTLPQGDPDALARWITSGAAGYCQMFSASMTELLRLLGVRARVAEGFVTGRYDPASKSYVVDDRDAHAWVEAWIPGAGFVPFDPTPGRSLPTQASSSSGIAPGLPSNAPTTASPSDPGTGSPLPSGGTSPGSISQRASRLAGGNTLWLIVALAGGLVLLAAAAWLIMREGWRARARGPRAEAGSSRSRLAARARRRGVELPVGVSNGELADALAARLEIDAEAWMRAADCAAYAPDEQAVDVLPTLREETRRLRKAIASNARVTLRV
jgi:transglutaminase-like putative cysteine protease